MLSEKINLFKLLTFNLHQPALLTYFHLFSDTDQELFEVKLHLLTQTSLKQKKFEYQV